MNRDRRGQGLVSYALILTLVAVLVIAVLLILGKGVDKLFCKVLQAIDPTCVCDSVFSYTCQGGANTMSCAQQSPNESDVGLDPVIVLWQEAHAQEESIRESIDLVTEAVGEGLDVMVASEVVDPELRAAILQALQLVWDGNEEAVVEAIAPLAELDDLPLEVGTEMSLRVAPGLIGSCATVSSGVVADATMDAALQAVQQLDNELALQRLQDAVDVIEARNSFIETYLDSHTLVLQQIVAGLESAGEWDLAAQVAEASQACEGGYNLGAGFVTGGGWIDSPAGAYFEAPDLTGKATFGFVYGYKKTASAPEGHVEFQFGAGDLNFHSTTYDWLVVGNDGATASLTGRGTVNGSLDPDGNAYRFRIWAGDGPTSDGSDTFQIRIWINGGDVIYNNGPDQAIGGGSIVLHDR